MWLAGAPGSGVNYVFTNQCDGDVTITPRTGGVTDELAIGDETTFRGPDEFVGQSMYLIAHVDGTGELEIRPESAEVGLSGSVFPAD